MGLKNEMPQPQGIAPALLTPIDEHGGVATAPLERLLDGQAGEGLLQTVAMRKTAAEVAVRNAKSGFPALAGQAP